MTLDGLCLRLGLARMPFLVFGKFKIHCNRGTFSGRSKSDACNVMGEDWEQSPSCNVVLTTIDWPPLTDLFLIGSIESGTIPHM
jgi:hypothetical protein